MNQDDSSLMSRRAVLRAAGAVGVASLVGASGVAGAASRRRQGGFGNGNGVGAFLNEKAEYKPSPVWRTGVVDATGRSTVEVVVGSMTGVDFPPEPDVPALPVGFAPQAVAVSPGTTVVWTWATHPAPVPPIPHDVVSLDDGLFDSGMRPPGSASFEHTFDAVGNYLYYCTPHGAPFPVHPHGAPEGVTVYNEFGMRGAVLVTDD